MPLKIADDRRVLLLAAGVFVVLMVLIALLAPGEPQDIPYPSSYSAASGGAKAAYLTLKQSGYNVERWVRPPEELPPDPDVVLIVADPIANLDRPHRDALQKFVATGGHVLAVGITATMLVPGVDAAPGARLPAPACPT